MDNGVEIENVDVLRPLALKNGTCLSLKQP
jgi:hypothetical protein